MVKRKATQLYLQVQLWNRWFVLLTLNCELQQTWQANFNVGLNKIDEFHETGITQISIPSASEEKKIQPRYSGWAVSATPMVENMR